MKIVLTIHHFPPNYSAGAEVYVFRLANWLIRRGCEVDVVCVESIAYEGNGGFACKHETYEGISVWRLYCDLARAADPFNLSFDNPAIGEWFEGTLQRLRPDVVHVNSCYLLSVSTIAAVKRRAIPLIVTLHDFWFVCPRITLLKPSGALCKVPEDAAECAWCLATEKRRFRLPDIVSRGIVGELARRRLVWPPVSGSIGIYPDAEAMVRRRASVMGALREADLILAAAEFLRELFVAQGIDPVRIVYSRLGLDTGHWIQPSRVLPASDELRIGYIGQLAPHKGVHLLVRAFGRLDRSRRGARLTIHGDPTAFPDYARSLRRAARGDPSIRFAGRFDNRRVAEILNELDVIVVPSIWYENSPITIMEALTTGTPVVATNLGGMPELVRHGVNGLLFEVGDVQGLATQLQCLLGEPGVVDTLASGAHPVRMIDDEMAHVLSFYESCAVSQE